MRTLRSVLWLLLLFSLLVAGVWLTRHPDAELVHRARQWPLVGPLAMAFQRAYLPPPAPAPLPPAAAESSTPGSIDPRAANPRQVEPRRFPPDHPRVWGLKGMELKRQPTTAAETVLTLPANVRLPKLDQQGSWYQVYRQGFTGWVLLENYDEQAEVPFGNAPLAPGPLQPRDADPEQLASARELLGPTGRELPMGPYTLYTDVLDETLISYLAGLAEQLDGVYAARYGRQPLATPRAALVLYRGEGGYRLLKRRSGKLAGLHAAGHASGGMAATFVGRRSAAQVGITVVHELVHLVNRRALGPALPPWLDEGLADGLALSRVNSAGALQPEQLGGEILENAERRTFTEGMSSLWLVEQRRRDGRLPRLSTLLRLDWDSFVGDEIALHYASSALWLRFLLDGEGGRRAAALRRFLDAVAAGGPASADRLRQAIAEPWPTLEVSYRRWVEELAIEHGVAALQSALLVCCRFGVPFATMPESWWPPGRGPGQFSGEAG